MSDSKKGKKGCLPRVTKVGQCDYEGRLLFPEFGTEGTPPLLSNREMDAMPDVIDPRLAWHRITQSQQSSCCGCMGAGGIMLLREIMGLDRVILSQASLYGPGNGGRDQGMAIDTCLEIAMSQGACSIDVIDQYDWRGYYNRTWSPNYKLNGARYKILKAWDSLTYQHIRSAYKQGHPVCGAANGHAFLIIGDDVHVNSYGRDWGNDGIGKYASIADISRQLAMYGAFVPWLAVDPINDGDVPQPQGA